MHTSHRSFWKELYALVLALIWVAASVIPAYADIAPPPPPEGYTILPGNEKTQVRMMYENVFMDIDVNGVPKVDANFVMRNLGDKEETMDVYFPLYSYESSITYNSPCAAEHGLWLSGGPITDLAVWVWDKPQPVRTDTINSPNYNHAPQDNRLEIPVPCWGVFPVTFPPGLDVPIEVKYTSPSYSYILTTGAGWNGTIGQADINFRLPYEVIPDQNYEGCYPNTCTLNGREIQWSFKDFEPKYNLSISIGDPAVWWRILVETSTLKLNPRDGAALGRLAIAYKDFARVNHAGRGYVSTPANLERYRLSYEFFQKALALLPEDANLHLQFAKLIYIKAEWDWATNPDAQRDDKIECARQLKRVLEIQPQNEEALSLFANIIWPPFDANVLATAIGPHADEMILTSVKMQPSLAPWNSPTPTFSPAAHTPTQTQIPLSTITPGSTNRLTAVPVVPSLTVTSTPIPTGEGDLGPAWGWVLVPVAALLLVVLARRRGGK